MAIKKVTEYTGDVADPYGSQTQAEFTQNAFNQFGYLKNFSPDLNSTIDEMNAAIVSVEQSEANAAGSAAAAEAAASSSGYKGLWPDTGGSAIKGDVWQTQVGGTPTGDYFIALQDNAVTPSNDNVNWRAVNDHSELSNRNAYGAHSASSISTSQSVSVQEFIDSFGENKGKNLNKNKLAVGIGESSSVGASWNHENLRDLGFISSVPSKNNGWLAIADSFQYVDIETPFGVIIGDSIAEGHGSPDRHGRLHTGTSPIYDLSLPNVEGQPSYHLSQKTNMHWYNQGIGGQTTTQILERFRRDALGETVAVGDDRPDSTLDRAPYCVWVNAGVNDISYGDDIEVTKSNLIEMCDLAREAGVLIGFNTCGPHNSHTQEQIDKQIELQSFVLRELPKRGAYVFDFRSWFEDPNNANMINPDLNADGVHPNGAGYLSYCSNLIEKSGAPIVMKSLCFESKFDPDGKPSSAINAGMVNLYHVSDDKSFSSEFENEEASVCCNFDMTNTKSLRAYIVGDNYPVSGSDWVGISKVYGEFSTSKNPDQEKPNCYATIKHSDANGFELVTSSPFKNFIDAVVISTTHVRVRFTKEVSEVECLPIGSTSPYAINAQLTAGNVREFAVYFIDRSTGLSLNPNSLTGTFFFRVKGK